MAATFRSKNDFDIIRTSKNVRTVKGGRYFIRRVKPGQWHVYHRDSTPTFIGRCTSWEEAEQTMANHAIKEAQAFHEATGLNDSAFDGCYDCANEGFSACMC